VQGSAAPPAIVAALAQAYARRECDLLLVVRGGGSLEDLWAFNDETVARQLAVAPAPTLAGIGHETDTSIIDYVADRRAATPTAAAELASAGWFAARTEVASLAFSLQDAMQTVLEIRMQALDRLALRLIHPAQCLAASRQQLELLARRLHSAMRQSLTAQPRLDRSMHRLRQAMTAQLTRRQQQLSRCQGALAALSPHATLERGYSIVRSPDGAIVRDVGALAINQTLGIQFARGQAKARVESIVRDCDQCD
jgi:exodeoxyribonuclease VII large subunit